MTQMTSEMVRRMLVDMRSEAIDELYGSRLAIQGLIRDISTRVETAVRSAPGDVCEDSREANALGRCIGLVESLWYLKSELSRINRALNQCGMLPDDEEDEEE